MKHLSLDIETFSGTSLAGGVYPYAQHPDFQVLLIGVATDTDPQPRVIDLTSTLAPHWLIQALLDNTVVKHAFNAQFERVCLSIWLQQQGHLPQGVMLDPEAWCCTLVQALSCGLPGSLEAAAQALGLPHQKDIRGKALIKQFCTPQGVKQPDSLFAELGEVRVTGRDRPQDWADFIDYCRQDVVVEQAIWKACSRHPLPAHVWCEYTVDQRINDRGVRVDTGFAQAAIAIDTEYRQACLDEMSELTGLANPNSAQQLAAWLEAEGVEVPGMAKTDVADMLEAAAGTVARVLELRQEIARTSVKKYQAMIHATTTAGTAHGLIQFYGAGRTGRWAGRLVQVQNLPRNYLADLDDARELVTLGDGEAIEMLYESLPDVLSQLIRTAFIPSPGNRFIVADYSAIEARVLAWLAGEEKTLAAFQAGKDLYCATASAMFGVPVEKHGANADLRQKGKIATLACGYGGGEKALEAMGALRMGLTPEELQPIVDAWRQANPAIVSYWRAVEQAAHDTVTHNTSRVLQPTSRTPRLRFDMVGDDLTITLPSGRNLVYPSARIENKATMWGRADQLVYNGVGVNRKFRPITTYGGRLVENITQAVARDLLGHALTVCDTQNIPVVMHIHDEIVVDAPPTLPVDTVTAAMTGLPAWAAGLPLTADAYECTTYRKD